MEERRRLYDERLVKEIMISTAICIQELMLDDPRAREDEVCEFVESNFRNIIQETLAAEMERCDPPSLGHMRSEAEGDGEDEDGGQSGRH